MPLMDKAEERSSEFEDTTVETSQTEMQKQRMGWGENRVSENCWQLQN